MSFSSYAARLNNTAKKYISEMQKAETTFKEAERAKRNAPRRDGSAQTDAKIARLEADYQAAKAALDMARRTLPQNGESELAAIRRELAQAVADAYTVNPAQVDTATVELLKSGVCKAADFEKLLETNKSNTTMIRLIASYAKKAYDAARESKTPVSQEEIARLYYVSQEGQGSTETELLKSYDTLTDIFKRTMNNTGMASYWDELTGQIIEQF